MEEITHSQTPSHMHKEKNLIKPERKKIATAAPVFSSWFMVVCPWHKIPLTCLCMSLTRCMLRNNNWAKLANTWQRLMQGTIQQSDRRGPGGLLRMKHSPKFIACPATLILDTKTGWQPPNLQHQHSHIHTTRSQPCSTLACNKKQVDSYTAGNIPRLQPRRLLRMHPVSKSWQRAGHASENSRMRNFDVPPHHPWDAENMGLHSLL